MLQIVILLFVSWAVLWFYQKKNLSVLGFMPTMYRLKLSFLLLIVTSVCCVLGFVLKMYFLQEEYILNQQQTIKIILQNLGEHLRGVVTEELLCRGALLYILIKKIGNKWAILASSILFGILHWFNGNVLGNILEMLFVFAFTFSMGAVLAYSYVKTFSLLIPIAIHFAWNVTEHYIFPETFKTNTILVLAKQPPEVTVSYFIFFLIILLPKLSAIAFNFCIVSKQKTII